MLQLFINNGFDPGNMFMIKSLGDEIWLHLEAPSQVNGDAILRVLLDTIPFDPVVEADPILKQLIPSGYMNWKIAADVVDGFIDCGELAMDSVRVPFRSKSGTTYGSPYKTRSKAENARLRERLAACVQIKGHEDEENVFAYRFDPVGWQVDRFHRLKDVCRKDYEGDVLVVGQDFMHQFFPEAAKQVPDANSCIRWQVGSVVSLNEYEGIQRAEVLKGFDEPYTYYFVRRRTDSLSRRPPRAPQ
jgi:hypothetical protein